MIRRHISIVAGFAAAGAAGMAVALTLAASAFAWSPDSLPPGWTVDHIHAVGAASCPDSYRIHSSTAGVFSDAFCTDSPTYQQDFDGWVNSHYTAPPPPTTQAAAPTTTSTDPAPSPTTTAASAPAPTPVDTTPTATTTAPACDVQCQLASLQSQIDALRSQLTRLVQILETWPNIDPSILAELMALQ